MSSTPCFLHALVREVTHDGVTTWIGVDHTLLEKLFHRRLVRLRRVLEALGGKVLREGGRNLLAVFPTAASAVTAACEMQRRCAVIPQVAGTQIALSVGIHVVEMKSVGTHDVDPGELIAVELASACSAAGVAVSQRVVELLPEEIRERSVEAACPGLSAPAYAIDWNRVRVPAASQSPSQVVEANGVLATGFVLRLAEQVFRFDHLHRSITVGRDPRNDVVVDRPQASRHHCRILRRDAAYVLVDESLNGTHVRGGDGKEIRVHRGMCVLEGAGWIEFGAETDQASFQFELVEF